MGDTTTFDWCLAESSHHWYRHGHCNDWTQWYKGGISFPTKWLNERMGSKHIPNIAGYRKWHSFPSGGSDLRVVFKKILSHWVIIIIDLKRDCLLIYDFWYQSNVCMNLWDLGYCNWMMCSHHCFPLSHINYLKMLLESGCTSCTPLCRGLVQGASVWISGELHEILKYTQACLKFQSWFYHPFGIVYCIATWYFYTAPVKLIISRFEKTQVTPNATKKLTLVGYTK